MIEFYLYPLIRKKFITYFIILFRLQMLIDSFHLQTHIPNILLNKYHLKSIKHIMNTFLL